MPLLIVREDEQVDKPLKSPEAWLCTPIHHLGGANDEQGRENTDYKGPEVLAKNMKVWEDFVTARDIRSQLSAETLAKLQTAFSEDQLDGLAWGYVDCGLNINERSFESSWSSVRSGINLVLKIVAERNDGEQAEYVLIGDGDIAKRKAIEYLKTDVKRKKPSYKAITPEQFKGIGSDNIDNRIPGDAKIYRKMRHSMLPPNGEEYLRDPGAGNEAMKVLKQIYNYMDQHEARYGYIVNNEEIVFFRRQPYFWGHMSISPPIKHKVKADLDNGILNSKYVLFYFLHVIATDENKWRLPSCFLMVPKREISSRKVKKKKHI